MLTAYFDDSGTHGRGNIVLVAGVFGTEWQLTSLDGLWRPHIQNPLCGRRPTLRRFHAYDCDNSIGEFSGWSRNETDYFCHQLRTAIIESGVSAYGVALSRRDYNQIVRKDMRGFLGDVEGYAITQCFVRTLRWAQNNSFDPQITFVFDPRPRAVQNRAKAISDAFKRHTPYPEIVRCAFLSSYAIRPLQAADLIAWEVYRHANEIYAAKRRVPPSRRQMRHLSDNMNIDTQWADREAIKQIVRYIRGERDRKFVRAAADHFTLFDPDNPDYSHLSADLSSRKRALRPIRPARRLPRRSG